MSLRFTWDDAKAITNLRDHDLSFKEAETVFGDPLALDARDDRFEEAHFSIYGRSAQGRLLAVGYAERGDTIRIITARKLEPKEVRRYANR